MDFLTKYSSQLLGITRIVIGLLFLEHGTAKVLSFPLAAGAAPHANHAAWPSARWPACLLRLRRALDELVVGGIETTIPLFQKLVREPDIINGDYSIHWLEKYLAALGH